MSVVIFRIFDFLEVSLLIKEFVGKSTLSAGWKSFLVAEWKNVGNLKHSNRGTMVKLKRKLSDGFL
jgi:hypothetical protein